VDGEWIAPSEQSEIRARATAWVRSPRVLGNVVDVALDVGSVKGSTSAAAVAVGGPVGSGFRRTLVNGYKIRRFRGRWAIAAGCRERHGGWV
jgi:hypothetical protein